MPITEKQANNLEQTKAELRTKKGTYREKNYQDLVKRRYNERNIRKYKSRVANAEKMLTETTDPELAELLKNDIARNNQYVRAWQKRQRDLLAKNTYLKREYRRESPSKMAQDLGISIELKRLQKDAKSSRIVYENVKEKYKEVRLNGFEKPFKKRIETIFKSLAEEYSINTKNIAISSTRNRSSFGWSRSQIKISVRGGKELASFEQRINISNVLQKSKETSVEYHKSEYERRGSKLLDDESGLTSIYHEFAHQIDDWYILQRRKDLREIKEKWETLKKYEIKDIKEIIFLIRKCSIPLTSFLPQ